MKTGRNGHRKRRNDRNHIVYKLTCAATGESYIGITVANGRAFKKSLATRWQKHVYHAVVEERPYRLQEAIRTHGEKSFEHEIIRVVRGKAEAHTMERAWIKVEKPALNTECTAKKRSRWENR
jgi:hypothetical protein